MDKLLNLVPQFRHAMATRMQGVDRFEILTNIDGSSVGSTMIDHQNLVIKVDLRREEISGCIIDGGSGMNLINKATCNRLGITEWEVCPF